MRRPVGTASGVAHDKSIVVAAHDKSIVGAAHAKTGERSTPRAGAAVVDRVLASAIGEVGRERRLGQHDNVGNSIEASQGGARRC
jgi:hypothetical protein